MRYTHPALLEHLASSYVLGTLRGGARKRFERLQADRQDVRLLVTQWEARLGQLALSVAPQKPSAQLWPAIAARTQPAATKKPKPAAGHSTWLGGWAPAGWGLGGVLAGALAAGALFFAMPTLFVSNEWIAMRSGERLPPSYVGLLTDEQGNGKVLVSSLRHGKTIVVKIIGAVVKPPVGHLVLWAMPANGPAVALGEVPSSGSAVSTLPQDSEHLFATVSKLRITLETDALPASPQGATVYSGNCAKLW